MRVLLLLLLMAAANAQAAGRICTSRDVILFGERATGTTTTQTTTVSNCGDQPFSFTDVGVHPATAAARQFHAR